MMRSLDAARRSNDRKRPSLILVTKSLDSMRESLDLGRESVDAEPLSVDRMTPSLNPTTTSLFGAMRSLDPESVSVARLEQWRVAALEPAILVPLPLVIPCRRRRAEGTSVHEVARATLEVPAEARARIAACTDLALLEQWLGRAADARQLVDVLPDTAPSDDVP